MHGIIVYMSLYVYTMCMLGACGGVCVLDLLELELQMVVSHHVCARTESVSSAGVASTPNC